LERIFFELIWNESRVLQGPIMPKVTLTNADGWTTDFFPQS